RDVQRIGERVRCLGVLPVEVEPDLMKQALLRERIADRCIPRRLHRLTRERRERIGRRRIGVTEMNRHVEIRCARAAAAAAAASSSAAATAAAKTSTTPLRLRAERANEP